MITVRRAAERGRSDLGWLDSRHTFSFGDYHDERFMGFRDLRVINDDRVRASRGFGTHGHRDMEIVSYVLEGALEHRDSLGTGSVIRPGEVQRMSAGSGVTHSEFNASETDDVHFLQIWILPATRGLAPSYEQRPFPPEEKRGRLRLAIVSTAKYFVPRLLGPFCHVYPGIDIALEIGNRDGVLERLAGNRDDLYIVGIPPEGAAIEREPSSVQLDLFLLLRAGSDWSGMEAVARTMAPSLRETVLVREQLALALNRLGRADEAVKLLEAVVEEIGSNGETCGLLGRVYKDFWRAARATRPTEADHALDQAIESYWQGLKASPMEPYPGVNLLTLLSSFAQGQGSSSSAETATP